MLTEVAYTCRMCGHEEHGEVSYASAIKDRMWGHIGICHPTYWGFFDGATESRQSDLAMYT